MERKYIYGIIPADEELGFGTLGLGGSPVYTVGHRGLGCVASDYAGPALAAMLKEEVVRCLLAHQAVVERAMEGYTVLPVKFGTLLTSAAEVRHLLSQGHSRFASALAQLQDKVEVEVAATWDTSQVLREIGHEDEIVRAREAIAVGAAQDAFGQRVRLGQMVKEALDRRRDSHRERMISFLRPLALDAQPNALLSDQLVLNVAFLVERAQQEQFYRRVQQLNDLFHDQINFRIIGPLPPYSFSTVEVIRPSWDKIEEAKRLLGLGAFVSESAVRGAYRPRAAQTHPDLSPGDALAQERFARLREASAVLLAYCRGVGGPKDATKSYPVTREAVEGTFLVTIKRSANEEVEPSRFGGFGGTGAKVPLLHHPLPRGAHL